MDQEIDVTCVAPACDFSVVTEGSSRLGCHRADGGGKSKVLTWRTEQRASVRQRAMCSGGHRSQWLQSRAHPDQTPLTWNRQWVKEREHGVWFRVGWRVRTQSLFLSVFKETPEVLACSCEEGRTFNPSPKWACCNGSGSSCSGAVKRALNWE